MLHYMIYILFQTPAIQIFDADDNSVKKANLLGEMSYLHKKMGSLCNTPCSGPEDRNCHSNSVICRRNNKEHMDDNTKNDDSEIVNGCEMLNRDNTHCKHKQQQRRQQCEVDGASVSMDIVHSKKKANRPDHLNNVQPVSTGYSSDRDRDSSSSCSKKVVTRNTTARNGSKSKDIETWLVDVNVPVGKSQQIDDGNGANSNSIEVEKNGHGQNDLQGTRLSQHEKKSTEIKSAEGNTDERGACCFSLLRNCSNASLDPDYVRGRAATRTESRLRKQSCPNFKDRPVSQMDNKEKLDNTQSGRSPKSVTGDLKEPRILSGPDKAFSRALRIDLKRVKENGRLVFYFKSPERPRSLSPNCRLASDGASRRSGGLDSSEMTSRKSSDVTSRKSSAQSGIFSPSPNEKLRAGVAALRDMYKEHYAVYSGRPWSAGAAR